MAHDKSASPRAYLKRCLAEALPHFERGEPIMEYAPTLILKALCYVAAVAGIGLTVRVPPAWLLILPLLVLLLLWAPYRVWQKAQHEVDDLEEQRRPRLLIVPLREDQFLKAEGGYLIRVRNKGLDELKDCYVHLEKIIWKTYAQNASGNRRDYYKQLFSTDDIYFHWKGAEEERRLTFATDAFSIIAEQVASVGGREAFALSAIGVDRNNLRLIYDGAYFLVVQIGASNHDYVRCFYRLVPCKGHGHEGEWVEIGESDVPEPDE